MATKSLETECRNGATRNRTNRRESARMPAPRIIPVPGTFNGYVYASSPENQGRICYECHKLLPEDHLVLPDGAHFCNNQCHHLYSDKNSD